jgi:uncharacterized membrane protein
MEIIAKPRSGHARSFVKAVSWRVIGTLDTFLWGLFVTGQPLAAGAIAALETFTKVFIFYLHERAWQWVAWDPDGRGRALAKAFTWRFVGSLDTFILSMLITGNAAFAMTIATGEALTKIVLYYAHERIWYRIPWGRKTVDPVPAAVREPAA